MIILTPFQISALITACVSLFLGLFVFFGNKKSKLNFAWLLTSASISAWSLGLFGVVFFTDKATAWFWQYILDIGGICSPLLYFNFLLYFTKRDKKILGLQLTSLIAGIFLIALNFTDLFKTGISPKFGINYWIDPGKLYFLFPLYFILLGAISIFIIAKEYRFNPDINYRRQLIYVLIAQIFGFGGGLTDFFPQLFNVYPFGNYFIILYTIFISYTAMKHHLFDIKVIAAELLTFGIWIVLLIKLLFSNSIQDLLVNGGLFLAMAIFGVLLIRSVIKEVEQREKVTKALELEKQAKQEIARALEMQKKALDAEKKANDTLEVFMAGLEHDIRGYLTPIITTSSALIDGSGAYSKFVKGGVRLNENGINLVKMFERKATGAKDQADEN